MSQYAVLKLEALRFKVATRERVPNFRGALLARLLRFKLALLLLLLVGACSSTTFVYNRLDIIIPWYLDDYVELNSEQDKSLDNLLGSFLQWHRLEELPRYVDILQDMEAQLDQKITPEVVRQIFSELEQAMLRLEEEAMGLILKLGDELSDEQIAEFLAVLQKQQEKYEKKYLSRSSEENIEDSYDDFVDGLQDYLGRLDKSQRAVLRKASTELIRMDGLWLEERASWLLTLNRQLQREPGWQARLRERRAAREENYSAEYREAYAHNMAVIYAAIASVVDSRSERQDRHVRKELKNLREDFETLIAQGLAK